MNTTKLYYFSYCGIIYFMATDNFFELSDPGFEVIPYDKIRADDMPQVVFDVNLGRQAWAKEGGIIDYDPTALQTTLDTVGCPPDNHDLYIEFVEPGNKELGRFYGVYQSGTDGELPTTYVSLFWEDLGRTQDILQHELRHHTQGESGEFDKAGILSNVIHNIGASNKNLNRATTALATSLASLLTLAGIEYYAQCTENPIEIITNNNTQLTWALASTYIISSLIFATLSGASMLDYHSPYERDARDSEKLELPPVISIDFPNKQPEN